jgi:hypothetical protein
MPRVGVLGLVVSAASYFVFPGKFAHLLPVLVMLLLWLASSRRNTRPFLLVLIAALVLNGLVTFRPLVPDSPARATTGVWDPAFTLRLMANDVVCRLDAMDEDPQPLNRGA